MAAPHACAMAPRHVYSATIKNLSSSLVKTTVYYVSAQNSPHQVCVDVDAHTSEHYAEQKVDEKELDQTYTITKRISKIEVTRQDGNTLKLEEPFEGVFGPVKDWQFHINDNQIKSVKN